ncbi:unnamed protein product [Cercopithifilaria johnstoni]|uniref:Uncharacterized protein n=1 Tax=Cercopithifilaria johnstoni TaxID=2874296 RepID=A0A8J2M1T3_9BILA|nr:unnamed protein product [Cercopithifilaria johnstoni]
MEKNIASGERAIVQESIDTINQSLSAPSSPISDGIPSLRTDAQCIHKKTKCADDIASQYLMRLHCIVVYETLPPEVVLY